MEKQNDLQNNEAIKETEETKETKIIEVTMSGTADVVDTNETKGNDKNEITSLKVKADPEDITPEERKRSVKMLAGAISHALRNRGEINVRCFGAATVSKAIKSIAIARGYLKLQKINLDCSAGFITTKVEGGELTGLCFVCFASEQEDDYKEIDVEKYKTESLMVKADPKDISAENRKTNLHKLSGAISHALQENKMVVIRAFGSAGIHKMSKALAVSRSHVASRGFDLYFYPVFIVTQMSGQERTGIALVIKTNES